MVDLNNETLQEAEINHYKFQTQCYFSGSKRIKGALLLWSKINDSYWNYATKINTKKELTPRLLRQIITFYKQKNRKPAIYYTSFTRPKNLPKLISKYGFSEKYEDVWMFYEKPKPKFSIPKDFIIKKITMKNEMETFVDIFNKAFGGSSPDEPYGKLPKEYGDCLLSSYFLDNNNIINYLCIQNKKPVGVATLIYKGKFGCIYNVGTLPEHRGKGIGKILTLNAVYDSIEKNAEIVFLQIEKGSYNEKYYTKLGFYTKFVGKGVVME